MDISRIKDEDYINYLTPGFFRNRYLKWKNRMIQLTDILVRELEEEPLEKVQSRHNLTDHDIGMLVRLNYVDRDFAEKTGMAAIERLIPR